MLTLGDNKCSVYFHISLLLISPKAVVGTDLPPLVLLFSSQWYLENGSSKLVPLISSDVVPAVLETDRADKLGVF